MARSFGARCRELRPQRALRASPWISRCQINPLRRSRSLGDDALGGQGSPRLRIPTRVRDLQSSSGGVGSRSI